MWFMQKQRANCAKKKYYYEVKYNDKYNLNVL